MTPVGVIALVSLGLYAYLQDGNDFIIIDQSDALNRFVTGPLPQQNESSQFVLKNYFSEMSERF